MKPVRVYTLPKSLPEEDLATIFAKCARSPESFDEISKTVTAEGAAQFHEKYVLGYGHASVAEMAIPNFAFEGVSILASKILESMPRGAYQEKSTRAQNFLFKDDDGSYTAFFVPADLPPEDVAVYKTSMNGLFGAYESMMEKMQSYAANTLGLTGFSATRRAFDSLRYLLPIGTQTNLGMRMNGRDVALLISKLLSSDIPEFVTLGKQLFKQAEEQIPTLVKHTEANDWYKTQEKLATEFGNGYEFNELPVAIKDRSYARVIGAALNDTLAIDVVGMAMLANHGTHSMIEMLNYMPNAQSRFRSMIDSIMAKRGPHDPFPDEFDTVSFLVDMVMDYGAFRDLQRHRNCTQFVQKPTTEMGYDVPNDIKDAGLEREFRDAIERGGAAANDMKDHGSSRTAYLYMIPLAYRNRVIMAMTFRQAAYMIELRTGPGGHISYRMICGEVWRELMQLMPSITKHVRCHGEIVELIASLPNDEPPTPPDVQDAVGD